MLLLKSRVVGETAQVGEGLPNFNLLVAGLLLFQEQGCSTIMLQPLEPHTQLQNFRLYRKILIQPQFAFIGFSKYLCYF
jgi:hypothetical protein